MPLKDDLQQLIQGEVLDDEQTLTAYSKDSSIFELKPKIVVFPKDSQDIQKIIQYLNTHPKENLSITPRSAGTDMSGGAIGESII